MEFSDGPEIFCIEESPRLIEKTIYSTDDSQEFSAKLCSNDLTTSGTGNHSELTSTKIIHS
jgi:hypothetical protein